MSSETIKGIVTFTMAREILREGGYLLIDEIENHFNKEIVSTLMRFFKDSQLNKKGGVLFFSTHYQNLWTNMIVMIAYLLPEIVMVLL